MAADWLSRLGPEHRAWGVDPGGVGARGGRGRRVLELLGLPAKSSFGFVTGGQMANVTCLAAARHAGASGGRIGTSAKGLAGAPPLRVVVGRKRHVTVERALRLLGIGREQDGGPADGPGAHGRRRARRRARGRDADDRLRAGGRGEHRRRSTSRARSSKSRTARAHGSTSTARSACGPRLPRARAPRRRPRGGGLVGDRRAQVAQRALRLRRSRSAPHPRDHARGDGVRGAVPHVAEQDAIRDPMEYSPSSRAAPAATRVGGDPLARALGDRRPRRANLRPCAAVRRPGVGASRVRGAERGRAEPGAVPVRRRRDDPGVLADVQASGEAWMGGTVWEGGAAIRLSVSNWRTSDADIDRTVAAFERALQRRG